MCQQKNLTVVGSASIFLTTDDRLHFTILLNFFFFKFSLQILYDLYHRSKFDAAKHRLRTQNISSNFSEARFNTP